jgi:hypothetical protein
MNGINDDAQSRQYGTDSNFINSMVTPYGTTTISSSDGSGYLEQDITQSSRIWFEAPHIRNGRVVQDVWRSSRIYAVVGDQAWCERAKFRLLMVPPYQRQPPGTSDALAE